MKLFNTVLFLLTILFCTSCKEKKPILEGFNSELWKKDKLGCNGKRAYLAEIIFSKSVELKGMDDDEVVVLLGKPEKSNWETRGKKTYYYYFQPGKQCNSQGLLEGTKVAIEFDALGRVKLVTEQKF